MKTKEQIRIGDQIIKLRGVQSWIKTKFGNNANVQDENYSNICFDLAEAEIERVKKQPCIYCYSKNIIVAEQRKNNANIYDSPLKYTHCPMCGYELYK